MITWIVPEQLELIIHNIVELDSDDTFFQGPHDEIYMGGHLTDSAKLTIGPDGKPAPVFFPLSFPNMDLSGDIGTGKNYEEGRPPFPLTVLSHDLRGAVYPRQLSAVITVIEEDNSGKILDELNKLDAQYREEAIRFVGEKSAEGLAALVGLLSPAAAAVTSEVFRELTKALARYTVSGLFDAILDGLANEGLEPILLTLEMPSGRFDFGDGQSNVPVVSSGLRVLDYFGGHGTEAHMLITYEWRLTRQVQDYTEFGTGRPGSGVDLRPVGLSQPVA